MLIPDSPNIIPAITKHLEANTPWDVSITASGRHLLIFADPQREVWLGTIYEDDGDIKVYQGDSNLRNYDDRKTTALRLADPDVLQKIVKLLREQEQISRWTSSRQYPTTLQSILLIPHIQTKIA